MESIKQCWDSGRTTPYGMPADEVVEFKSATRSKGVVGLEWRHSGRVHRINRYAVVLPDHSGVAAVTLKVGDKSNGLEVLNADGSLRFIMHPPVLGDHLDEASAVSESPRMAPIRGEYHFVVSAGYRVKQPVGVTGGLVGIGVYLKIDWNSGVLLDWMPQPSGA